MQENRVNEGKFYRMDPIKHPRQKGESWWIVHPNIAGCEFQIPFGAITLCTSELGPFIPNVLYRVAQDGEDGWVQVLYKDDVFEMPQYLFGKHFDAEAFVVGVPTKEEIVKMESAEPFEYKRTEVEFKDGK